MKSRRIEGATRVVGESQGYIGLALRDEKINCSVNGPDTPIMVTAWEPNLNELALLNKGAPIILEILGTIHPPIIVKVGPVPQ